MKKSVLYIVVGLAISMFISADMIAQGFFTKPMYLPAKYLRPTVATQQNTGITNDVTPQWWKVWVDRDGVVTSNGKKSNFMEEFFIVEEKDDRVHIVKDNGSFDYLKGEFSEARQPIDYGWVLKENLILWNSALYSGETNFRMKVLTIMDLSSMSGRKEQIMNGEKLMEYYNSPVSNIPNDIETKLFEVFYIYKKVGNRSLLGIKESLEKNSDGAVLGWVDNNIIQIWGHRQTLEPNSDAAAAGEREQKNIKAAVFASKDDARGYKSSPADIKRSFWNDDHYSDGYDTYWKRFPILSSENGIIETAVVSDLIAVSEENGELVMDTIDTDEYNELVKMYNEQTTRTRQINMVFVIDGTRSMQKPIEAVKKAVVRTAGSLQDSENKFRFGAVIYRDYANKNDEKCFETQKLGNYTDFYRFMNKVRTDDPACFNSTVSEGMYKGLYLGGNLFRGKERETNVIVLVGDAGDRVEPWRIGEKEVLKMLVRNRASLITLQAHHEEDKAYDDFIWQARNLTVRSAEELTEIQIKTYGDRNVTGMTSRPQFRQSSRGNRTLFNLEYSPVDGALQYAPKHQMIPPEVIETEVSRIIHEIDSSNMALLNTLSMMIGSYGESGFTREALQILINADFPKEFIELLSKIRYQFLLGGYTAYDVADLNSNVYDFVLFVDGDELDDLIITLNKLTMPSHSATDQRESLYNAFRQILVVNYGVNLADIQGWSIAEIMALITGLESTSELLKKYTLDDILDPITMKESNLNQVIQYINIKRNVLQEAVPDSRYFFISNLRPYYWLSQEMLP